MSLTLYRQPTGTSRQLTQKRWGPLKGICLWIALGFRAFSLVSITIFLLLIRKSFRSMILPWPCKFLISTAPVQLHPSLLLPHNLQGGLGILDSLRDAVLGM